MRNAPRLTLGLEMIEGWPVGDTEQLGTSGIADHIRIVAEHRRCTAVAIQ